jgi:hypothetical protein
MSPSDPQFSIVFEFPHQQQMFSRSQVPYLSGQGINGGYPVRPFQSSAPRFPASLNFHPPFWIPMTYPHVHHVYPHQIFQHTHMLQVYDLSTLPYHGIMELLGREDAALVFRFRATENRNEPIQNTMRATLDEIEEQYRDGAINRAAGPLNAENETGDEGRQWTGNRRVRQSVTQFDASFPYLAIRNYAMLDTARRLASYDDARLFQCLDSAHHIFYQRANGTKRVDQR